MKNILDSLQNMLNFLRNMLNSLQKMLKNAFLVAIQSMSEELNSARYLLLSPEQIKQTQSDEGLQKNLQNVHLFRSIKKIEKDEGTFYVLDTESCCGQANLGRSIEVPDVITAHAVREAGVQAGSRICGQCMAHVYADKP